MRSIKEGDVVDVEIIGEEWNYKSVVVVAMPTDGVWAFRLGNGTIAMVSVVLAIVFRKVDQDRELGGQEKIDSEPRVVR